MKFSDLHLSPKFAEYLSSIGLLSTLITSLKQFREKQNYPFELEAKRIIKQALAKSYADILGKLSFGGNMKKLKEEFKQIKDFMLDEIDKDADRVYGDKPETVGEEITTDMVKKAKARKKTKEEPDEKLLPKDN